MSSHQASLRELGSVKLAAHNVQYKLLPLLLPDRSTDDKQSLVFVSGVGTAPCDTWCIHDAPWADLLQHSDQGVVFHCFDHGISLDDQFTWQTLLDEGGVLLKKLSSLLENQRVCKEPKERDEEVISVKSRCFRFFRLLTTRKKLLSVFQVPQCLLFISHGLGGAIVKQALCVAGVHYRRYSELLKSIIGLIFLGTPHRLEGVTDQQFGNRLASILRLDVGSTLSRQSLSRLKDQSRLLSDLALRFNRTNLRVNMLSVFELKRSRIKEVKTLQNKTTHIIVCQQMMIARLTRRLELTKHQVVDEALCSVETSREQTLGVHLDHLELPFISGLDGHQWNEIWIWLRSVIASSQENINSQLHSSKPSNDFSKVTDQADDLLGTMGLGDSPNSNTSSVDFSIDQAREALTRQVAKHESSGPLERSASNSAQAGSSPAIETLLENFIIPAADPRIPCFMVDTFVRNKDFFGRKAVLDSLDDCLLPAKDLLVSSQPDRIRVALLCGMGGLGKTEAAIEYAYSRRASFDAVFWVRSEDMIKLEADIAQIAVRLGIQDPNEPEDKSINRGLAMEWLSNPFKIDRSAGCPEQVPASWLLIFDNADEQDILLPYQDIVHSGAILITSRNPLARTSLSHFTTCLDIQPFNKEDSGEFIQKLAGNQGRSEEAEKVGQRLGGLPLALAQMAGTIRLKFLSYAEFLEMYDNANEEGYLHEIVQQPLRSTARGSISTVWAVEELSKEARLVLEMASFLDPDCIQERILVAPLSSISIPNYPKTRWEFINARKQLISTSLFRHNQEASTFWMHRVTQDIVRTKIEPDRRRSIFSDALSVLTKSWPTSTIGGHDITLWDSSEAIYQHVASLKSSFLKYFDDDRMKGIDIRFAALLSRAAWYQHERGGSHAIGPLLELALKLCMRNYDEANRDLECDIRYALSAVANETNDAAKCMEHTQKFLELRLAIARETGQTDERLARAYNESGIAWMMEERYDKAEAAFSTAVQEYEKVPGFTKDKRSLPLVNLGLVYWLQGRLEDATNVLELGLRDREELYGVMDNHSFRQDRAFCSRSYHNLARDAGAANYLYRTGRFLHALGNVRFSQGRLEESEDFHRRALRQYQSTIRNRHHRTADVCHKVAQHCIRNRIYDQALEFIDHALRVWDVDTEKYAPEIARTSYLRAKALFSSGQTEEGARVFREATAMRRRITGTPHRGDRDLQEKDFDVLVTFWSR